MSVLPQDVENKQKLEFKKLELENQKLVEEIKDLKKFNKIIAVFSIFVTLGGFIAGIYQYREQQIQNRQTQENTANKERKAQEDQLAKDKEVSQREFMKPIIEKELALLFEASEIVSTIPNTSDETERKKAINNFWRLYQGPMIIIENQNIALSMKRFGQCLNGKKDCDKNEMNRYSRVLASDLRKAMIDLWNKTPENYLANKIDYTPEPEPDLSAITKASK